MKQIIKVSEIATNDITRARFLIIIGEQRYFVPRGEGSFDEGDSSRAARNAMAEYGYGKGGVFIAGWDDVARKMVTYTRLPLEAMTERAARAMFKEQPATENVDWFYY